MNASMTDEVRIVRCGDIGEDQREYEFEPFGAPVAEPVVVPLPVPDREPVPA